MKKKVLIVDDDSLIREVTKEVVEEENDFEVSEASNGKEALKLAQQKPFDLLITDICMPEMNGIKLVDKLREGGTSTPIIITSSMLNYHTRNHLSSYQSIYFIEKPFSIDKLAKTVENIVS
jgi:YesN/AraC family two-component response regulator